jgi:hypothetical protein
MTRSRNVSGRASRAGIGITSQPAPRRGPGSQRRDRLGGRPRGGRSGRYDRLWETILTAGAAGLVGGAISMGLGEYVSVNSQRDSQQAMITEERRELKQHPEDELDELVRLYVAKGLTPTTAQQVAEQLTAKDPVAAHVDAELNLVSEEDIANPSAAALTSAGSFAVGGALPFLTMLLLPSPTRVAAHLHRRSAGPGADREPERPARGQPGAETDYSGGGRRRNRLGGHLRTGRGPW